jgi:hypothetical protein
MGLNHLSFTAADDHHAQGMNHPPLDPSSALASRLVARKAPPTGSSQTSNSSSISSPAEKDPLHLLADSSSVQILSKGILHMSDRLKRCFVGAMKVPHSLQPSSAADAPQDVELKTAPDSANAEEIMDELMQVHQALSSYLPAYYDEGDESLDTKELVRSKGSTFESMDS